MNKPSTCEQKPRTLLLYHWKYLLHMNDAVHRDSQSHLPHFWCSKHLQNKVICQDYFVSLRLYSQEWFDLNHLCSFLFHCQNMCLKIHYMYTCTVYIHMCIWNKCSCKLSMTHILTYTNTNWQNHTSNLDAWQQVVYTHVYKCKYICIYTFVSIEVGIWLCFHTFPFVINNDTFHYANKNQWHKHSNH